MVRVTKRSVWWQPHLDSQAHRHTAAGLALYTDEHHIKYTMSWTYLEALLHTEVVVLYTM